MRLPISAILMMSIGGLMMFLYIVFNWAFMGPRGLKNELWDVANRTMSGDALVQYNELMPQLTQGFGVAMVMCFSLAIIFFIVDVFRRDDNY